MNGTASNQEVISDAVAGDQFGPQQNLTAAGSALDAAGMGGFSFGSIPTWAWIALGGLVALKVMRVI